MNWDSVWIFLRHNWFGIAFIIWLFYFAKRCGMGWFKDQLDWVKQLFVDDDAHVNQNAPSHKNAIFLALTVVFIITFLKKVAFGTSDEIPDIPGGWQLVLLAGLGIAAAKSGAQKLFENKWGNGNGDKNGVNGKPPTP